MSKKGEISWDEMEQRMNSQVIAKRMVEKIKEDTAFKHEAWDTKNEPQTAATGLIRDQGESFHVEKE